MKQILPNKLQRTVHEYILEQFGQKVLDHCKHAELRVGADPTETELVLTLIVLEEKVD